MSRPVRIAKAPRSRHKYEILGLTLVAVGVLALVSLFNLADSNSGTGRVGTWLATLLVKLGGQGKYLLPLAIGWLGVQMIRLRSNPFRLTSTYVLVVTCCLAILTFLHLQLPFDQYWSRGWEGQGGGILGAVIAYLFTKAFGLLGTYIVLGTFCLAAVVSATDLSLVAMVQRLLHLVGCSYQKAREHLANFLFVVVDEEEEVDKNKEVQPVMEEREPIIIDHGEVVTGPSIQAVSSKDKTGQKPARKDLPTPKSPPRAANQLVEVEPPAMGIFVLPPLSLLDNSLRVKNTRLNKDITDNIRILEETLDSFGVRAKVTQVNRGPTITRYEMQPAPGIKVSKIVSLADDIALSLAAPDVRIEAPIPGKAAVGIEVPNKEITLVNFREVLESQEWQESSSKLTVALGKDIAGNAVVADLTKMPHLLIAGATGSGKSVCMNTLIASLLFRATPDEVKFLMFDPKMVELTTYNGIPHLITPVVTNPKKAAVALRWVVTEMEKRYEKFATSGTKDMVRYNQLKLKENQPHLCLPYIVVLIDELADLMMIAPADVEDAVIRLAQMARAAGIHLVLATQRPSVDVITGLIKANIPSRIAFAVSSQIDSRTILDMNGAERLLGRGDMLFMPVGAPKPIRVQGAYISDREVEQIVNFLRKQGRPQYVEGITNVDPSSSAEQMQEDELLPEAVRLFIEAGQASISLLQRRFRIGYTRAARLIDMMEERGIIGRYEGSKPREVLMTIEQYENTFGKF